MNNISNKTILVTGGAGYIGAHFINRLINTNDCNILVLDNFSQSNDNVIHNPRIKYFDIDLMDCNAVLEIFQKNKIDAVLHFAAVASVPDSVIRPNFYYQNNIVGGINILNAMLETGVKTIINSSSAGVYGEPQTEVIAEDHPKLTITPYGYSKLILENFLKDYKKAYGMNSISFRYFCACGCDESGMIGEHHNPETHVIPMILQTLLGKKDKFLVFGNDFPTPDGTGIRDYIHVNDLADAHILALQQLLDGRDVCTAYNLGINKGFSVLELIKHSENVVGKKLNYEIVARREGDPSRLIADSSLAQNELGWKPKYLDIENMILTAYNFWKKQI